MDWWYIRRGWASFLLSFPSISTFFISLIWTASWFRQSKSANMRAFTLVALVSFALGQHYMLNLDCTNYPGPCGTLREHFNSHRQLSRIEDIVLGRISRPGREPSKEGNTCERKGNCHYNTLKSLRCLYLEYSHPSFIYPMGVSGMLFIPVD